jgi:myo-inositol-1(or 4)-monophosphatase
VAEGKLDASVTLSNQAWDMAAGVVLAREAGGLVVDEDGTIHSAASRATLAGPPQLIEEVVALVREARTLTTGGL